MVVIAWSLGSGWKLVLEDTMASSSIHQRSALPRTHQQQRHRPVPALRQRSSAFSGIVRADWLTVYGMWGWIPFQEALTKWRKSAFSLELRSARIGESQGEGDGRTDDERAWQFELLVCPARPLARIPPHSRPKSSNSFPGAEIADSRCEDGGSWRVAPFPALAAYIGPSGVGRESSARLPPRAHQLVDFAVWTWSGIL